MAHLFTFMPKLIGVQITNPYSLELNSEKEIRREVHFSCVTKNYNGKNIRIRLFLEFARGRIYNTEPEGEKYG